MNAIPYLSAASLAQAPTWQGAVEAIISGHRLPRAQISDTTLANGDRRLMSRLAWIDGLGAAVKSFSVLAANPRREPPLPSVQGACLLLDDATGAPVAMIDFALLTWWKTAADSVLGAMLLGPEKPRSLVVIGAGTVARSLCEAYAALFPSLCTITVCARRRDAAEACLAALPPTNASLLPSCDPEAAVSSADIVATATASNDPVLKGCWLRPGTHVDLVGAYAASMREADDSTLMRGELFVDCRDTTLEHIGELLIPIERQVISADEVRGDFYDLLASDSRLRVKPKRGERGERGDKGESITVFKNGGGAHLDLMIGHYFRTLAQ
ncbi:MAG: ornithine cyclodeaminase [Pseudomonadota bacterium]